MRFGKLVGEKGQGESRIIRNALLGPDEGLIQSFRGMTNLKEIFEENVKKNPKKSLLGTRNNGEYKWKTFQEIYESSKSLANFLYANDLCPEIQSDEGNFHFIGIFSKNREEWAISDWACMISSITSVPLYDTLGVDSIEYIINQTEMKTIICSADKIKSIIDLKAEGKIKHTTHIVYFDEIKIEDKNEAKANGITLIEFN